MMKPQINLISIFTENLAAMRSFYERALGFSAVTDLGSYVEFANDGVRFALCEMSVMRSTASAQAYAEPVSGQRFGLAFPCSSPEDVDASYHEILQKGAAAVAAPAPMPWGQYTAYFADPDGNIHEFFADLPQPGL